LKERIRCCRIVLILRHPARRNPADLSLTKWLFHQYVHCLLHGGLGEFEHRLAVRFLIACVGERVERQRILIRGGDFLFDQAADDARLDGGKFMFICVFQLDPGCFGVTYLEPV